MHISEIDRFIKDFTANPSTFESSENLEQAVSFANQAGYNIREDEARHYLAQIQGTSRTELSDMQLDAVAGGKSSSPPNFAGAYKGGAIVAGV